MFKVLLSTLLLRPPGGGKGPGARGGKVRTSSGGRRRSGGGNVAPYQTPKPWTRAQANAAYKKSQQKRPDLWLQPLAPGGRLNNSRTNPSGAAKPIPRKRSR